MENLEIMQELFGGIYAGKKVLITGHTGFKGSWLTLWLRNLGAEVSGFSLDAGTEPAHFKLLKSDCRTQYGDIRDRRALALFFSEVKPDIVFHLAAQSLVRDSYRDPLFTYETNIIGTLNVLEAARSCGSVKAFVNVTTDKVYENTELGIAYREQDALGGYDMYSSSKACSELLTASYRHSFLKEGGLLLASARAGNVIGGGDWAKERLIPDLMRSAVANETTEIRSPQSIRPWEHVLEPLSGYLLLGQQLLEGKKEMAQAWNFGPAQDQTLKVSEVIAAMKSKWGRISFQINEEGAKQFHEAGILRLDCSKANWELGWKSVWNMEKTVSRTVSWYKNYFENNCVNSQEDLERSEE